MIKQPEQFTTWYGLKGTVRIDDHLFHRSGFGRIAIFHPGAVNWFLRRRLLATDRKKLTYQHEWGHLQTAPIFLIYMLLLAALQWGSLGWFAVLSVVIVSQALWEIVSELAAILKVGDGYFNIYQKKLFGSVSRQNKLTTSKNK